MMNQSSMASRVIKWVQNGTNHNFVNIIDNPGQSEKSGLYSPSAAQWHHSYNSSENLIYTNSWTLKLGAMSSFRTGQTVWMCVMYIRRTTAHRFEIFKLSSNSNALLSWEFIFIFNEKCDLSHFFSSSCCKTSLLLGNSTKTGPRT